MLIIAIGIPPKEAVNQMLAAAISEIRTEGFGLTRGKTITKVFYFSINGY